MSETFEDTPLYKRGQAYSAIGDAMMNQDTTLRDLAEIAFTHGVTLGFVLGSIDEKKEGEK
ncbi:MAG: hypothetical protein H7831_17100 [Magnetococcus sp. WYHC-3]